MNKKKCLMVAESGAKRFPVMVSVGIIHLVCTTNIQAGLSYFFE
jgi:hypothetical protein